MADRGSLSDSPGSRTFLEGRAEEFRREAVEQKNAHDYVSYVDKESERRVVSALRALLPEAGLLQRKARLTITKSLAAGLSIRWTARRTIFTTWHLIV